MTIKEYTHMLDHLDFDGLERDISSMNQEQLNELLNALDFLHRQLSALSSRFNDNNFKRLKATIFNIQDQRMLKVLNPYINTEVAL